MGIDQSTAIPSSASMASDRVNGGLVPLSPAQARAADRIVHLLSASTVVGLTGVHGSGRTSVLRAVSSRLNGKIITPLDILKWSRQRDVLVTDEALQRLMEKFIQDYELVLIDDFEKVFSPNGRGQRSTQFSYLVLKHVYELAERLGKKIVVSSRALSEHGETAQQHFRTAQVLSTEIEDFDIEDYQAICASLLGEDVASAIDFETIHRHAGSLTGHQLRFICNLVRDCNPSTSTFLDAVGEYVLDSNIRIEEVEALSFNDLPGTSYISAKLETQVVLPILHPEVAKSLDLKPKRGVLLYGPPGTGKTSVGRALAHRMQGKFFMIDGTFVTEPPRAFFASVRNVIRAAKRSAPCVLFIDDADVLFEIEHISGLSRYLLTLLDGLESATAGNVCVVMTAMDVRKVPEALLRSGRVEVWLKTSPPDVEVRASILKKWIGTELPGHQDIDYALVASDAAGLTAADLRRLAQDAKALYAADVSKQRSAKPALDYLLTALKDLAAVRNHMAHLLDDSNLVVGQTPPAERYGTGHGGLAEIGVSCKTSGW